MAASHNVADNTATSYSLLDIASTLAWGLGYFGMPHILLRFMAIEDEKKLVLSRRIASVWVVIAMTASIVIGMVGLGMTKAGALEFLSGSSSETLIVRVASLIAQHGVLAAILAGLILAGILAATMSTADSQMLAAASSVSQNILQEFGHMKLTEKQSLFAARLTIICISVVGVVLARDPNSSVFGIVSFAWAGFGGSFGAVVLCSLFWKRCNWQGRTGRYALRRPDGLCMEVHHQPAGRRVWHLRAAACLPDVSGGLRCGEPCYPGTLGRDRGRVRRCQVKTI